MATSPTTINLLHGPIPSSPIIVGQLEGDPAINGNVRAEWYRFFASLWARTGGPTPSGPAVTAPTTDNVMIWG